MSGDIVERLRRWDGGIGTHWSGCMDAHPVCAILFAADAIEELTAERDASRLIINDLTAEVERLRAAGDRLAAAINAVACSGPRDEMAELTAAYIDWEARRG